MRSALTGVVFSGERGGWESGMDAWSGGGGGSRSFGSILLVFLFDNLD